MRSLVILLLCFPGLLVISCCKPKGKVLATPPMQESVRQESTSQPDHYPLTVPQAINEFSFSLYDQLGREPGNIIYSPYSISSALAMTWAGARNNTAMEMSKVLNFNGPPEKIHEEFRSLAGQLELLKDPGMTLLAVANALWAQEDYVFLEDYIDLTTQSYAAGIQNLDFTKPASCEQSRQTINRWIEERTNYKIRELIGPGMLTTYTRLVLTNAIWFNGSWMHPFNEQNNHEGEFRLMQDLTATVTYMNQLSGFGYYEDNDLQAIELPYQGNEIAMLVVLPRELTDLGQTGKGLTRVLYDRILSNLVKTEISLSLPKFKSETDINLKGPLQLMGMREAFSKEADFSGMTGNKGLFIDFVIHRAFIEVHEKGTEAAAATAVGMALKSAYMEKPLEFIADHPFYYLIFHRETRLILFSGRFVKPSTD